MKIPQILPVILSLALCSCATTDMRNGVADALPYIAPASELATGAILQFSEKDITIRRELAVQLRNVAGVVRTLATGDAPTVEQFHEAITSLTPTYPHWLDMTTSLTSVYAGFFPKIKGDPKLAIDVLAAIAEGVENAASRIAPAAQPTP